MPGIFLCAWSVRLDRCPTRCSQTASSQEMKTMAFPSWLRWLKGGLVHSRRGQHYRPSRRTVTPQRSFLPRLEVLEDRTVPSTFTVTTLADSGPGSLRAAITAANTNPGADVIRFAG